MGNLARAICDRALPGTAPEWVHLLPGGQAEGRDGRTYVLSDPERVIADFRARNVDLPIDYNHAIDRFAKATPGPIPAAGWIKELQVRTDGLWGRVEWTAEAARLIASKAYRYLSPVILYDAATRSIHRVARAGLVHDPNLHLTALASEETDMDDTDGVTPFAAALAEMLGLEADTSEAAIVEAIRALLAGQLDGRPGARAKPSREEVAAMAEALRERNAALATMAEERVRRKVEDAFAQGYITGGMRPWATALCASDEDAFDGFLKSSGAAFAHLTRPSGTSALPPSEGTRGIGTERGPAADMEAMLGLKPGALRD